MAGVAKHLEGFPRRYDAALTGSNVVNVVGSSPPRVLHAATRAEIVSLTRTF